MPSIIKSIESLAPGMIVDREVEVRGMVLLKAGTALTDTHIAQLKKWHVLNVSIASDSAPGAADAGATASNAAPNAPAGAPAACAHPDAQQAIARIEQLFSTAGDDKQMQILKAAMLRYLGSRA